MFDCPKTFYMVMEKMTGGELFDRIVKKEKYSEEEAKKARRRRRGGGGGPPAAHLGRRLQGSWAVHCSTATRWASCTAT